MKRLAVPTMLLVAPLLLAQLLVVRPIWADERPEKLIVATWNLEWFYDEHIGDNYMKLPKEQAAPSRAEWDWKLAGIAKAIAEINPTIIALQEVENRRVLFYLTSKLKKDYNKTFRVAYIEGSDYFTEQDVAILYQSGLTSFTWKEQTKEEFAVQDYYHLNKHLFAEFEWGPPEDREKLSILNLHLRAAPDAADIRTRQGRLARKWMNDKILAGENVIIMGDLNTNDLWNNLAPDSDIGVIRGLNTPSTDDDLFDTLAAVKEENPYTHLIMKQFDRILLSPSLTQDAPGKTDLVFKSATIRRDLVVNGKEQDTEHREIYWKIPEEERDFSDHYPLVTEFEFVGDK